MEHYTILNENLSRYVVDMNRPAESASIGDYRKTVVYQENTQGSPLYSSQLDENEINRQVSLYYAPYHQALEKLLREKLKVYLSIYDLKDHHLIALLDGRDTDTFKEWLTNHKKIKLVARDRASAYAKGITPLLCFLSVCRQQALVHLLESPTHDRSEPLRQFCFPHRASVSCA